MSNLIEYLLQFGDLTNEDITTIEGKASELRLRKDEYFSQPGTIPRYVGFITEGVMRGFYYDGQGNDITRCFINENSLVVDYVNFDAATPSSEYLQACTACSLAVFSRQDWDDFSTLIPTWDDLKGRMVQRCMFQKSRTYPVVSQDATTRYMAFMENYPNLTNRVPLAHISSFLGVTQQSLSRIRRNIR